jgi:RNA polymerase sigma-70 factor (ECF subfamily)
VTSTGVSAIRELSDDELLAAAQQKDEAAFAELMRRNSSSSLKLALSILKDRQDAEDEVQNSYLNAWRYVDRFRGGSRFSTWMSRIVTNQCLMRLRRNKRAAFLYLDQGVGTEATAIELPDSAPTPEAFLADTDEKVALHNEIRRLPPLLRNVLVLSDLNELPIGNVAERLGISIVAAKSRLQRSRAELRRRMLVPT